MAAVRQDDRLIPTEDNPGRMSALFQTRVHRMFTVCVSIDAWQQCGQ